MKRDPDIFTKKVNQVFKCEWDINPSAVLNENFNPLSNLVQNAEDKLMKAKSKENDENEERDHATQI